MKQLEVLCFGFFKSLPVQSFLCLAGEVVVVVVEEGCPHLLSCCEAEVFAATFLWDSVEHSSWDFPDVPRAHASLTSPLVTSSVLLSTHPICNDVIVDVLWSVNEYDGEYFFVKLYLSSLNISIFYV